VTRNRSFAIRQMKAIADQVISLRRHRVFRRFRPQLKKIANRPPERLLVPRGLVKEKQSAAAKI
jgi:hypothetical protein